MGASPPQPGPRLVALDVLRALAAVAVVSIHLTGAILLATPVASRGYAVAGLLNQVSRFAVPAFVLLTGAGLFYNYGRRATVGLTDYYKRRAWTLGIPYVFWSVAYFAYYAWLENNFGQLLPRFWHALATGTAIYTLYYFLIVTPFYLLFPLLRRLATSRWLGVVTVAAIVGNAGLVWFSFPTLKFPLGPLGSELYVYIGNTHAPWWWMGPFFLGAWLALRWDAAARLLQRWWPGLLAIAGAFFVWVMHEFFTFVRAGRLAPVATNLRPSAYWYGLLIMLAIVGLGLVVAARGGWFVQGLLAIARYSFGIYLVHPFVMAASAWLLRPLPLGPVAYLVCNFVLVLSGSYGLTRLLALMSAGRAVIGLR